MHVFTYGSLMYRRVWTRVVPGGHAAHGATIRGFARRRIRNEVYPALVRAPAGSAVRGVLYSAVSASDLALLDRFENEGESYGRIQVPAALDTGELLEAWTYLYLDPARVDDAPWDPNGFEADDLDHFLNTYCRNRLPEARA